MGDIFGNIFDDEEEKDGAVQVKSTSPDTSSNQNESIFGQIFSEQTEIRKQALQQQSQPEPEPEQKGFFAKAVDAGKSVAKFGLDVFNKLSDSRAESSFQMREMLYGDTKVVTNPVTGKKTITSDRLEAYKNAQTPEERSAVIKDADQDIPLVKLLNTDAAKKTITTVSDKTSNVPLKIAASISAIGDKTYEDAYAAYLAERNNPENGTFKKFLVTIE